MEKIVYKCKDCGTKQSGYTFKEAVNNNKLCDCCISRNNIASRKRLTRKEKLKIKKVNI